MTTRLITITIASIIFIAVIELIRRERLTFKYAFGWLAVSLLGIVFSLFDQWLFTIAQFFGFELASNFVFFTLLTVFVFLTLLLTIFLCQQNNRNDIMAQKIGMLEEELERLKKKEGRV